MSDLMEMYKKLVEFLGNVLGENAEIVLQDLENESIVAIANGQITNRKVGSPLTDYALNVLKNGTWKEEDYVCNYEAQTGNKKFRSSTFYIKEKDELIGMLCINIDYHKYYEVANQIMALGGIIPANIEFCKKDNSENNCHNEKNTEPVKEILSTSIEDMVWQEISQYMQEKSNLLVDHFDVDDKIAVVKRMNDKGLFLMKGTVSIVAEKLLCSEASIYRYLTKLSK